MTTDYPFLPSLPLTLSYPLLFGALLVAGMIGGEIARQLRLPRVVGYVLVGFAIAPGAAAMNVGPLLDKARIFVDIGLGLVLFDLGRRLDLTWLKRDWTLAATSLAENLATFGLVFAALTVLGFAPLMAGLAAAIAMATSPAVVLLVAQDTRADGQVTERALTLVALNSLLASVVVTMLTAPVHYEARLDLDTAVLHPLYLFVGSLALGGIMAWLARLVARHIDRSPELHFTLVAGLVLAAVGLAQMGQSLGDPLAPRARNVHAPGGRPARPRERRPRPRLAAFLCRAVRHHGGEPAARLLRGGGLGHARLRGGARGGQVPRRGRDRAHRRHEMATVGRSGRGTPADVVAGAPASQRRLAPVSLVRAEPRGGRALERDRDGASSVPSPPSGASGSPARPRPSRRRRRASRQRQRPPRRRGSPEGAGHAPRIQCLRGPHVRRGTRADGAQHARLQPLAPGAGPALAPREGEAAERGEAGDHREHDRGEFRGPHALRRPAGRARANARRHRRSGGKAESRGSRRRLASLPPVERAAHLPDGSVPQGLRALRLSRQAVHRLRPAHPCRASPAATTRSISRTRWPATFRISSRFRHPRPSTRARTPPSRPRGCMRCRRSRWPDTCRKWARGRNSTAISTRWPPTASWPA